MKYRSINRIEDFEFHDAQLTLESYINDRLVVSVKYLNVHKGTEYNQSDFDMEIELAKIVFERFVVQSFEPCRTWKQDENGNLYTDEPRVVYEGKEASGYFRHEIEEGLTLYYLGKDENNIYSLDSCGEMPFFSGTFTCDSMVIEWENYRKKAWYELHKTYNKEVFLATSEGIKKVKLLIHCNEEDDNIDSLKTPKISLGIKYKDKQIFGRGNDFLWTDAFADLQKQLPEDVIIQCCMTCGHGNMCPVGNKPNELFCTKDVAIMKKSDLYFYTEDDTERKRRSREYTDWCEFYVQQTEDYFTYNDYLFWLKRNS